MQTIPFSDAASMRVALQALSFADRSRCAATPSGAGYDLAVPPDLVGAVQAVNVPAALLDDRRARLVSAIDAKRDGIVSAGYQHNFGNGAGIRTLDCRTVEDQSNWLALHGLWSALDPDEMVEVIDAGNAVFETSAATGAAAIRALGLWKSRLIIHARNLKNTALAAADAAALDAIAIETGWPD